MGDRYFLEIVCHCCGFKSGEVYFAPTSGFVTWTCVCGVTIDLYKYTGITYEESSNLDENRKIVEEISAKYKGK